MKNVYKLIMLLCLGLLIGWHTSTTQAQTPPTPVECGRIVEGEIRTPQDFDDYSIELAAGDTITLRYTVLAAASMSAILLNEFGTGLGGGWAVDSPASVQVGLDGTYTIRVNYREGVSQYTLYIGCTIFATGQVIEPGDAPPPTATPALPPATYPNLAPTTFTQPITLPLVVGIASSGAITSAETYQYTVEAIAGQAQLDLARVTGNLNLGLVVLSPSNEVLFYGGLIASTSLTTTLQLPTDGTYSMVVFPISVTPPSAPETTAFQLTFTPG